MPWDSLVSSFYRVPKNNELSRAVLDKQFKPKVNYIGQLNGMKVYDVIYMLDDNVSDDRYLKTIVLQKDKLHSMAVFYDFIDKDRYFPVDPLAPTYMLNDKNLVASKLSMTGSGGLMDEYYLYIPKNWHNGKIPIIVNDDVVSAELKNHLPKRDITRLIVKRLTSIRCIFIPAPRIPTRIVLKIVCILLLICNSSWIMDN